MRNSALYRKWSESVCSPPTNDFLVVISASSRTPVSGTGKTTLATGLAKAMDRSPGGFDAEEQSTLNAEEFGDEVIPSVPHKAAVVMDETQGTPGEGSGMNRMRAMAQSTMDAINSVMANRDKNLTIILVVQQIGMLFSDIYPMIDAWLLISKAPGQFGGPKCKHHTFYTEDYPDGDGGLKTPIVEMLDWPDVAEDDPDYLTLEAKKQAAKTKGGDDGDDGPTELSDDAQLRRAKLLKRTTGVAWRKLPEEDDENLLTYSGEWYRQKLSDDVADGEKQTA